ncbi:DUF1343 domain-containing protein [bacterium]|nr:DUF1343 domain-containing protein [bacterium]
MFGEKSSFQSHFIIFNIIILIFISSCARQPVTVVQHESVPDLPARPMPAPAGTVVKSGLEVFLERDPDFEHLTYGLLANQTCVNSELIHGVKLLEKRIDLQLILSPEHGLFGAENAGDAVGNENDITTGIRSLTTYRKNPEQIAEMIKDLDVILFDIQDIGIRSYTYIYSMAYLMQAAAIASKKVIILDRPNPLNGNQIEGNLLDPAFSSFVGLYPIPYRHGMTTGELALLFNSEFEINCDLEIVKMVGWEREMWFDETGLPWVPTSPHVPDAATILPMISTGTYGELGMLSEGVGITIPFEVCGGPWIKNPGEFAQALQERAGKGVIFRPTFFKPYYGRHKGQVCGGIQLHITDRNIYSAYLTGLLLVSVHQELYPEIDLFQNEGRLSMYAKVMGSDKIQKDLQSGKDPLEMEQAWLEDLGKFGVLREKYLLYN